MTTRDLSADKPPKNFKSPKPCPDRNPTNENSKCFMFHGCFAPVEYINFIKRDENLRLCVENFKKKPFTIRKPHLQALETSFSQLLTELPRWVGISGDGKVFTSECEVDLTRQLTKHGVKPNLKLEI